MPINNEQHTDWNGYAMPSNPNRNIDSNVEEVTRKIAPAMITPSLGPMPPIPAGMLSSSSSQPDHFINAYPRKASPPFYHEQTSSSFSWKLTSVPVLPESHRVERSAAFVPNAEPIEVASRISDMLRERSIQAQYENGKAKVKCTTNEGVDFRIRLYRGRGRYNHGIIVEVQRIFGTSLMFHSDTQAILEGAQGKTSASIPTPTKAYLPEVSEEDTQEHQVNVISNAESSFSVVEKMMQLSGFDSQYLALQMLSPLVDSKRLSASTARAAATILFHPGSKVGKNVMNYVANKKVVVSKPKKRGPFDDEDDDSDEDESYLVLRNLCLNILANAAKSYGQAPTFLRERLRSVLIEDLSEAETHPNTAFLAAKCLEHVIPGDECTAELNRAFRVAHNVGQARHANLMRQAKKCMDATDSVSIKR